MERELQVPALLNDAAEGEAPGSGSARAQGAVSTQGTSSTAASRTGQGPATLWGRVFSKFLRKWRTSLQVRVVGSVFVASTAVVLLLGFAMIGIVGQLMMSNKEHTAAEQIGQARATVEKQINATDSSEPLQTRLNSARAALTENTVGSSDQPQGPVQPVLLVHNSAGHAVSPEGYQIPEELQKTVGQDQVALQYQRMPSQNGGTYKALIVGTPTVSDVAGLQVYLVMPLTSDDSALALMRGVLTAASLVMAVLLVAVSWLLTQQITTPVRSASRIAQRFAAGHWRERMVVEGEEELARLASSFNSMAESLETQIRRLKEYGDLQRQFTSDVSHELRTPLTTVRMAADMIADQSDQLDPATRRAAELMNRELDRFEALLADLLEISRHDAGVAELAAERSDLRSPVSAAWKHVEHLAQDLGVEVNFDLPDQEVPVEFEASRIERVLRNLMANAIDHSEGNPVNVKLRANDEAAAITVTDHGVGLKKGQEELVFNRFWRADPSRVRHSGGTGLGLAIATEDANLHGGQLEAIGEEGVGACFRLTLPLKAKHRYKESPLPLQAPDAKLEPTLKDPEADCELEAAKRGAPGEHHEGEPTEHSGAATSDTDEANEQPDSETSAGEGDVDTQPPAVPSERRRDDD